MMTTTKENEVEEKKNRQHGDSGDSCIGQNKKTDNGNEAYSCGFLCSYTLLVVWPMHCTQSTPKETD